MLTLADTASALAQSTVTAVELVKTALLRAKASEHVFTELFSERALTQARASDARRARGEPLGPLDGIPLAIKDLFDVRGHRTLAGSLTRQKVPVAQQDATVIAALLDNGMIPLGRTNMSELAFSGLGLNPHFGTPVPDFPGVEPRVPGGSSSGSAVAVQRGIVTAALGSDTGGSIRVPAAFNGLVGFKSSPERYSMVGVHPLAESLDSLGPIARTVQDCVLLDAAMRGLAAPIIETPSLRGSRFVIDTGLLEDDGLESSVRSHFISFMERLERQGAQVERRRVPAVEAVRQLIVRDGWLGAIEGWAFLRDVVAGPLGYLIDPRVSSRLRRAADIPAQRVAAIRSSREGLLREIVDQLDGAFLAMPTVRHVAPVMAPLEQDEALFASTNLATLSLTMIGSFLNMPGLAMPSGVDAQGLPTSVLISGVQGSDDQVLAIGLALESAISHPR